MRAHLHDDLDAFVHRFARALLGLDELPSLSRRQAMLKYRLDGAPLVSGIRKTRQLKGRGERKRVVRAAPVDLMMEIRRKVQECQEPRNLCRALDLDSLCTLSKWGAT